MQVLQYEFFVPGKEEPSLKRLIEECANEVGPWQWQSASGTPVSGNWLPGTIFERRSIVFNDEAQALACREKIATRIEQQNNVRRIFKWLALRAEDHVGI